MKPKKDIVREYIEKYHGSHDKHIIRGNILIGYDDTYIGYVDVAYYDKTERKMCSVCFFQECQVYSNLGKDFFKVSDTTKYKRISDYIENYIY